MTHTCPNCGAAMTGPGKLETEVERLHAIIDDKNSRLDELARMELRKMVDRWDAEDSWTYEEETR